MTIKELDGRIEKLRDETAEAAEQCIAMPSQSSRQATADQINQVVALRERIDQKHKLLAQLSGEKVRLATQATDMVTTHLNKLDDDLVVFHEELATAAQREPVEPAGPPPGQPNPHNTRRDGQPSKQKTTNPADVWAKRIQRLQPGDQVAANTSPYGAPESWIIATATRNLQEIGMYEVRDEEAEEGMQSIYQLPPQLVMPLPRTSSNRDGPNLPPGLVVLAVYPSTTTFYRATVVSSARRLGNDQYGEYILEFEDDYGEDGHHEQRAVEFRHVVPLPPG